MKKTRYVEDPRTNQLVSRAGEILAPSGFCVDADGNPLGWVSSITLCDPPSAGEGVAVVVVQGVTDVLPLSDSTGSNVTSTTPTPAQLEREAVERVWDYYVETLKSTKRLDRKRYRIINNAIALVGEEAAKKAILGLSRSPFHNGQNDQRRRYLEIRYALRGIGDESDDERIERAISWAAIYAPQNSSVNVDPVKVQRWLDDVRYTLSLPHRPSRDLAVVAYRRLQEAGFTVAQIDKAPWARLERG